MWNFLGVDMSGNVTLQHGALHKMDEEQVSYPTTRLKDGFMTNWAPGYDGSP
jgi:hypothetical protein